MTGEELWKTFLGTGAPDAELVALGHDLFWTRPQPGATGASAVARLATKLGIHPGHAYAAFNIGPGRPVLEGLAAEYGKRLPWDKISSYTRAYLNRVAERIVVIKNAMAQKKSA